MVVSAGCSGDTTADAETTTATTTTTETQTTVDTTITNRQFDVKIINKQPNSDSSGLQNFDLEVTVDTRMPDTDVDGSGEPALAVDIDGDWIIETQELPQKESGTYTIHLDESDLQVYYGTKDIRVELLDKDVLGDDLVDVWEGQVNFGSKPKPQTTTTPKSTTAKPTSTSTQSETTTMVESTTTDRSDDSDSSPTESNTGSLSFGETHMMTNGMKITVDDLRFEESYYDGYSDYDAPPGEKWLFVTVTAENTGNEPAYGPNDFSVKAIADNTQYNPDLYIGEEFEAYEWAELQPGITEEGVVIYAVDDDVSIDDIEIVWYEQYYTFDDDANVRWS
ncbi:DUF4352 domain-containing protein [Haladaptatus sp. DFWS20]|uniref:DUF4352 domain-containing protein n=1 Tax=Haladaptatus sp. DFWS20 TaxID=3403467 RepID=UPI003EBFB96A